MKKLIVVASPLFLLLGCSEPPKPQIPALTPEIANQQLRANSKAAVWLTHVKKQNPACDYSLDIPEQTNQPTQLDFSHIVKCAGRPAPLEFDASVSFEYDKAAGHWTIMRFSD